MTVSPAVSILVTVYNRKAYLASCLDSILASSWRDFELVVVDDGSSDGSAAVAAGYSVRDPRIRFHQNAHNLGDYPNRMRAVELARGKYIKYVDSDDLIYRHSLAIMMEAMEANPGAALGLSHSSSEDGRPYPWLLSPTEAWTREFLGGGCMSCGPSGSIIRKDAFLEIDGFRDRGVLSDIDLWYRMSAKWPVLILPQNLVFWRRHPDQEFTKKDAALVYLEKGFALTMSALSQPEIPLSGAERAAAVRRARQHHARRLLSLGLRQRQPRNALRLMRQSGLTPGELLRGLGRYQR